MKIHIWDGITQSITPNRDAARKRLELFAYAKSGQWQKLFELLSVPLVGQPDADLLNTPELDNPLLNSILHYAALMNADLRVVQRLVQMGAWRTRRNATGQRPVDFARDKGHEELYQILEPEFKSLVAPHTLQSIERHLHATIMERADELIEKHRIQLPQLDILLELDNGQFYFPIPGMYGGFNHCLKNDLPEPVLLTYSECRVVGGSEQMHKITAAGSELVASDYDAWTGYHKETHPPSE